MPGPEHRERLVLTSLTLVQFTHIMDFMVMMPLGTLLMREFSIGPDRFSMLVAAYGLSAGIGGVAAAFVLDRVDRRRALLALYAGFAFSTLACALAPGFWSLFIARVAAGAFGGIAGSIVMAVIGDVIPTHRRGRATGAVMSAFPLASILGVPAGMALATRFSWHAPFFFLAAVSVPAWIIAARSIPGLPPSAEASSRHPIRQVVDLLGMRIHRQALALSAMLVFAGASVIPFMAPSMVANAGLAEDRLAWIYLCGGGATLLTTQILGRLSDSHDKLRVFVAMSLLAAGAVALITRLGPVPLPAALAATTFFMVAVSGRFPPAMAMITNRVAFRWRGAFMSLNSSVQQLAASGATLLAGRVITSDATGRLHGYPSAGWIAIAAGTVAVALAARLRRDSPEIDEHPPHLAPAAPGTPAAPATR